MDNVYIFVQLCFALTLCNFCFLHLNGLMRFINHLFTSHAVEAYQSWDKTLFCLQSESLLFWLGLFLEVWELGILTFTTETLFSILLIYTVRVSAHVDSKSALLNVGKLVIARSNSVCYMPCRQNPKKVGQTFMSKLELLNVSRSEYANPRTDCFAVL